MSSRRSGSLTLDDRVICDDELQTKRQNKNFDYVFSSNENNDSNFVSDSNFKTQAKSQNKNVDNDFSSNENDDSTFLSDSFPKDDEASRHVDMNLNDNDEPSRGMMVGKPFRKLFKGDVVSTATTNFDGKNPGSYSSGMPDRLLGRVVSRSKTGGNVKVKGDVDGCVCSMHWTHLHLEVPKVSVETMLTILGEASQLKSHPDDQDDAWPTNFFDALTRSDWRDWVLAVKKENAGWIVNQATRVVKYEDMKAGARCIPLSELFSVKRDGRYKFRQIAFGNMLRPGKDYGETFASTVSADGMR